MLIGIDNRLNTDVLSALHAMGHGDYLVLADKNFPSDSLARLTRTSKLLRMENLSAAEAVEAVLSVMPIDDFLPGAIGRMEIVGAPKDIPPVQSEVQEKINALGEHGQIMVGIERFEFYERAKQSYCIIQTGETRFYGCFMLKKGVIAPKG